MRSPIHFICVVLVFGFACTFASNADAHDFLKKPLMERYNLKSVSCSACHPSGGTKAVNNKFGLMFKKAFKGKNYTARIKALKDMSDKDAAKKKEEAIGAEMVADFKKAIVEIEKTQMTIADMAKFGLLNGTKLQKELVVEMEKEQNK